MHLPSPQLPPKIHNSAQKSQIYLHIPIFCCNFARKIVNPLPAGACEHSEESGRHLLTKII